MTKLAAEDPLCDNFGVRPIWADVRTDHIATSIINR